jgi:hypothetical protein
MTLQRPHSRAVETPIERIFRKIMNRRMTREERCSLHIKIHPVVKKSRP